MLKTTILVICISLIIILTFIKDKPIKICQSVENLSYYPPRKEKNEIDYFQLYDYSNDNISSYQPLDLDINHIENIHTDMTDKMSRGIKTEIMALTRIPKEQKNNILS
jgi:hypothetical protein